MASIYFVCICFLFVFLVRDAQLLSAGPSPAFHWRLGSYWTVLSCCVLAVRGLNAANADEIMTALRSPLISGASVGLHVAGLSICLWLRRERRSGRAWLLTLFPHRCLRCCCLALQSELERGSASGMQLMDMPPGGAGLDGDRGNRG